jgi:hypothetical protein
MTQRVGSRPLVMLFSEQNHGLQKCVNMQNCSVGLFMDSCRVSEWSPYLLSICNIGHGSVGAEFRLKLVV